jgi:hypothetical protein
LKTFDLAAQRGWKSMQLQHLALMGRTGEHPRGSCLVQQLTKPATDRWLFSSGQFGKTSSFIA